MQLNKWLRFLFAIFEITSYIVLYRYLALDMIIIFRWILRAKNHHKFVPICMKMPGSIRDITMKGGKSTYVLCLLLIQLTKLMPELGQDSILKICESIGKITSFYFHLTFTHVLPQLLYTVWYTGWVSADRCFQLLLMYFLLRDL